MDIIVIGGGASGLAAAIKVASCNNKVTILEKNSKVGKKLLLTGNGRCNFWNDKMDSSCYHASSKELLDKILKANDLRSLNFLRALGIVEKVNNGYYYPYSNQAISVYNALLYALKRLEVTIKYEEEVLKVVKKDKFVIYTKNNIYEASKVILATGGSSYPKTGSDGKGYEILKSLGHKINPLVPSLVQLRCRGNYFKDLKGVRCDASLTNFENGVLKSISKGEVLFTDYGLSGICTFNLSGDISLGLKEGKKEEIKINFVPWFSESAKELKDFLTRQSEKLKNPALGSILEGFLNYKLVNVILKLSKTSFDAKWEESDKDKIVSLLTEFKVQVNGTNSFNEAEVTRGGVPLQEINIETFESLKVKDLYITGELLDVDGICGGYNLAFAFTSGLRAGSGASHD